VSAAGVTAAVGATARVRRTYFDCRYGQLHVHQAIPPGGGFDEATPLLCLPGARGLGSFFTALLSPLGGNRSIYAPDLPGFGGSDPVPAAAGAAGPEQWAIAMADLLDSLHQRRVDVLAQAEGAATALALKALRAGLVRRVVWSAPPDAARASARSMDLEVRELALAAPGAEALNGATLSSQVDDLVRYLSSDDGT
jgi:pimeloyl-ACP methyl ester carboxylesterase